MPALALNCPFESLPTDTTTARGVVVTPRHFGLATVHARKGGSAPLVARIREHFNIQLPSGPSHVASGDIAFVGTGPGAWLAVQRSVGNSLAQTLVKSVGRLASVVDQTGGYAVLNLSGPRVRDALSKVIPVDIRPQSFVVGDAASTVAAHIGAMMWRLNDDSAGLPVFEIAVFRSLAESFWRALSSSLAEYGVAYAG